MLALIRLRALALILVAASAVAACGNDPAEPDDDPADRLATIRLTIGNQTVNLTEGAIVAVTLPLGETTVTATFLDDQGANLVIPSDEFELRFEPDNTALVTFGATGAFAGRLTGVAAGATNVAVLLWHLEEDHDDFQARLVVTVQ